MRFIIRFKLMDVTQIVMETLLFLLHALDLDPGPAIQTRIHF